MIANIKHKILIVLLATFGMSLPVIIKPLTVAGCIPPPLIHYVLVLVVLPTITWIALSYGFKKLKENSTK